MSLRTLGRSWSMTPLGLGVRGVVLGEGGGDEGIAPALLAGMGQEVAGEVHAACCQVAGCG